LSNVGPKGRSFEKIAKADLRRLAGIAAEDREQFFGSHPDWGELYADRLIATALCQGAALHYVTGQVGIQDFDVYSFYRAHPARRWYGKRNKHRDYGLPKFGKSPDRPDYVGRRVDLLGRGLETRLGEDPALAIQRWLATSGTRSARLLAQKAVVLLFPSDRLGQVIWPVKNAKRAV
jgi:hypothetical protein